MAHRVTIHQKNNLPNLLDDYPTEQLAKEALKKITADVAANQKGLVLTPSGNVSFKADDFAGAEYRHSQPQGTVRVVR